MSGEFHTPVTLLPGNNSGTDKTGGSMGHRDGVGIWRREKSLARPGIRNPDHSAHGLESMLATPSRFPLSQEPVILKNS
jgi:hypothetical protein